MGEPGAARRIANASPTRDRSVMLARARRLGFAAVYAALPLYPAFIALTSVRIPASRSFPNRLRFAILALVVVLVAYSSALLVALRAPRIAAAARCRCLRVRECGYARGARRIRSAARTALRRHLRNEHFMALLAAALLRRTRRRTSDLLVVSGSTGALAAAAAIVMVATRYPARCTPCSTVARPERSCCPANSPRI